MKENGVYPPTEGEGGSLPRHENNSTVNSDNSSDMFDSEKVKSTAARSMRFVVKFLLHSLMLGCCFPFYTYIDVSRRDYFGKFSYLERGAVGLFLYVRNSFVRIYIATYVFTSAVLRLTVRCYLLYQTVKLDIRFCCNPKS